LLRPAGGSMLPDFAQVSVFQKLFQNQCHKTAWSRRVLIHLSPAARENALRIRHLCWHAGSLIIG
jgi:hypothetical protein